MKTKSTIGICCICGVNGKLTSEHFPPHAASNKNRVEHRRIDQTDKNTRKIIQGGIRADTICQSCNNNTGTWYGGAYADFAREVLVLLNSNTNSEQIDLSFEFFPLRVIKQVVCAFFSINGQGLQTAYPELAHFVLDKNTQNLPEGIRVFAFVTRSERSRAHPLTPISLVTFSGETPTSKLSEYVHKPLGFVMTFGTGLLEKDELYEITNFSTHAYDDKLILSSKLPIKPVSSRFPYDYRSQEKMEHDFLIAQIRDKSIVFIDPDTLVKQRKPTSHSIRVNFMGSGPVTGTFIDHSDDLFTRDHRISTDFLSNYTLVLFTACSTEMINDETFSVTHFSNTCIESQPTSVAYRGLSSTSAIRQGLKHLVDKYLSNIPAAVNVDKIAIITNLDNEECEAINVKTKPLWNDFYLPNKLILIHPHQGELGIEVFKLYLKCLEQSNWILDTFKYGGFPQANGDKYVLKTIESCPLIKEETH